MTQVGQNPRLALAEAARQCAEILAADPGNADCLFRLGLIADRMHRPAAAITCFRGVLALRPAHHEALYNLGTLLSGAGETEAAIACLRGALAQQPHDHRALTNLGSALCDAWRPDEAAAVLRAAVALQPDYPQAHANLGVALMQQGMVQAAAASSRTAIALRPDYAEAHNNLGVALARQGLVAESLASTAAAIALRPDYAEAHENHAMALLALGDLAAGWPELEWRWHTRRLQPARRGFAQPQWRGEPAAGATLLIHAEQGFGDTLQFCRYAALAAARGLRVVLEVQPQLARLLHPLDGAVQVIARGTPLPAFDLHCPMLSLPLAFATTLATIPAAPAYLAAPAAEQARLAGILPPGPLVGLAWAGDPRAHAPALAAIDQRRSIPPALLAPLFGATDRRFVSLQKGGPALPAAFPITDLMDEMTDFAATAALIANLDLVIAVDTAVVHLAAGMGREVWLLDRFDACWRWLRDRADSPWYPRLRIYRQPAAGDWPAVVAAVARDLQAWAIRS